MWPFSSDKKRITPQEAKAMQGQTQTQDQEKKKKPGLFGIGARTIRGKKGYADVMDVGQ